MTEHRWDSSCETVRDDLAELALGTLGGLERSAVLVHVEGCPSCRDEVGRLSAAADAVLLLAPEVEPSAGFETRLFERMHVSPPKRWRLARRRVRRVAVAASAVLGALGLGLGLALTSVGGSPAATSAFAANLTVDHSARGEVYVAPGKPGWLFMSIDHAKVTGLVTCRIKTAHAGTVTIGSFWLESGSGSWTSKLPVPADQVRGASIVSGDGVVLASASLVR